MTHAGISHFVEILEWLRERFPSIAGTDVNDRTVDVWRRRWVGLLSPKEIATQLGWSPAAVHWHLQRAERMLRARGVPQDGCD
jgi:DNA-binding CsgD family transcriptional regulator